MVKLQALNVQLCRKINSTTNIFQLIYLPFKSNRSSRKTSKIRVWILTCNVHYVTQSVLLLIFSCCILYVQLTNDWPFYETRMNHLNGQHLLSSAINKEKQKHGNSGWKFPVESVMHSIWKVYGNYNMSLLMESIIHSTWKVYGNYNMSLLMSE